ncbi:hypothetical protein ABE501_02410 [Comamonas testosteroni]
MEQAHVIAYQAQTGFIGLQLPDGSYALAEQLGNQPLREGQLLQGNLHSVGLETLEDASTHAAHEVFMQAYGLSAEGLRLALL